MKLLLFLLLFCCAMQAMETENSGVESQKIAQQKQVSFHDSVKDTEQKEPTPIKSVSKTATASDYARDDRAALDSPKTVTMKKSPKKGPKEEQVLDKCCPACWTQETQCCGMTCLDGVKKSCLCYIAAGPVEEFIRIFCCDCFFDSYLKEKSDIKESKKEDSDSE